MEAKVWPGTGLLPENLAMVILRTLDDGRWQAHCEFDVGKACDYEFAPGDDAKRHVADVLEMDLGFNGWCADETARRLFEPFEMAAEWAW